MSVVLLSNVGLRDVKLDGREIQPARIEGQRLLDEFDRHAARLSLPMIMPLVDHLLAKHSDLREIRVVLFGTDQPEGTPPEQRDRDTISVAMLAEKLLPRLAAGMPSRRSGTSVKVFVRPIAPNPSLYDDMLAFFRDQFNPQKAGRGWVRDIEICYACPVGGTPAANTGLMLAAIERFEECHVLYLPQGESHPVEMTVVEQMRRGMARRLAAQRLADLSFGGAAPLLEQASAPPWSVEVARYASERYHFDFESAAARIEGARRLCGDEPAARAVCDRLRRGLLALRDQELEALLGEVYHNAAMAYRRGEYAAFLGRVFRLQEASYRLMVEKMYRDLSTNTGSKEGKKRFQEYLRSKGDLAAYLARQTVNGNPLRFDEPTIPVLKAMVRYGWEGSEQLVDASRQGQFREAYSALERFERLTSLRNNSIIAHGFAGVSEARINEEYSAAGNTSTPLRDMAAALAAMGIVPGRSPFEEAAEILLGVLERA